MDCAAVPLYSCGSAVMQKVMMYIGYAAGVIFIFLGLGIFFTNLMPSYLPVQFKVMMGVVLILYGIFRIISTLFKSKRNDEEN